MRKIEILGKITGLVDGEVEDPEEEKFLLSIIYSDEELINEYQIQKNVKKLLKDKLGLVKARNELKQSILNKILN